MNKVITFVLIGVLISVTGCKPNHRYVYQKFEVSCIQGNTETMTCEIRLHGSEQYTGTDKKTGMDLSYLKSPYTILVSFNFPKEQSGTVELKEMSFSKNGSISRKLQLKLKREFDNITEFRKGGVPEIKQENESQVSFLIKQVDVPHSKLKVLVTALITIDHDEVLKTWEFKLTPYIEEELRNNLKDSIMSV